MSEPTLEQRLLLTEGNVGMLAHLLAELIPTVASIVEATLAADIDPNLIERLAALNPVLLELDATATRLVEALLPLRDIRDLPPPPE